MKEKKRTSFKLKLFMVAFSVIAVFLAVHYFKSDHRPQKQRSSAKTNTAAKTAEESAGIKVIRVAFGNTLPPWVLTETNNGIIVDLMREAMEGEGIRLEPVYYPHARRVVAYNNGEVDAVCDVNASLMAGENMEGYLSEMSYVYDNQGISLKRNGFEFKKISDLVDYTVLSWPGAKNWFKGEYEKMANANKNYRELSNIKLMVKLLYKGRVDLIQMDVTIFKYYRNKLFEEGEVDTTQPIEMFPLFWGNQCGFLFKDEAMQGIFDKNISRLKAENRYDQIYDRYIGK